MQTTRVYNRKLPVLPIPFALLALLVLVVLLAPAPAHAIAGVVVATGACGEQATWTLDAQGTLTVSGTGATYDSDVACDASGVHASSSWGIDDYRDGIQRLVVEDGITRVGNAALMHAASLKGAMLAPSVEAIGDYAFFACGELTGVSFGDDSKLASVGTHAFGNCSALDVPLPSSLASIGTYAFVGCGLTSLDLSANTGLASLEEAAFGSCMRLECVQLGASLQELGPSAFSGCGALRQVMFAPNGQLKTIGAGAFELTRSLADICIPASVESIGEEAFASSGVEAVAFEPGSRLADIGVGAFAAAQKLVHITVPASVTRIGKDAFRTCDALESVVFEQGSRLRSIDWSQFEGDANSHLKTLDIPASIVLVPDSALPVFARLERVYVGSRALYDSLLERLQGSDVRVLSQLYDAQSGLRYLDDAGSALVVGYEGDAEHVAIPEQLAGKPVKSIGAYAFEQATSVREIALPSCVETVGTGAFSGASRLERVFVPTYELYGAVVESGLSRTRVASTRLDEASSLRYFVHEGEALVTGCDAADARELVIPRELESCPVTTLLDGFSNCAGLQVVELPETLESLPTQAFAGCTQLESVEIPARVTTVGSRAFAGCTFLSDVVFAPGSTCTAIGAGAFQLCTRLETLVLPDAVEKIGTESFAGCSALHEVRCGENSQLARIGAYAFRSCTSLAGVELPALLGVLDTGAFFGCSQLAKVSFPAGSVLRSIGNLAFWGCAALEAVEAPASLAAVGDSAFSGCVCLTRVTLHNTAPAQFGARCFAGIADVSTVRVGNDEDYAVLRSGAGYVNLSRTRVLLPGDDESSVWTGGQESEGEGQPGDGTGSAGTDPSKPGAPGDISSNDDQSEYTRYWALGRLALDEADSCWYVLDDDGAPAADDPLFVQVGNRAYPLAGGKADRSKDRSLVTRFYPNGDLVFQKGEWEHPDRLESGCQCTAQGVGTTWFKENPQLMQYAARHVTRVVFDASLMEGAAGVLGGDLSGLLKGLRSCVQVGGLEYLQQVAVTRADGMFEDCAKLEELDLSMLDFRACQGMSGMFDGCESLAKLTLGDGWTQVAARAAGSVEAVFPANMQCVIAGTRKEFSAGAVVPNGFGTYTTTRTDLSQAQVVLLAPGTVAVEAARLGEVGWEGLGLYGAAQADAIVFSHIDELAGKQVTSLEYTGAALEPTVVVAYGDEVLQADVHYSVGFADNVEDGTATVNVEGKGKYRGTASAKFSIEDTGAYAFMYENGTLVLQAGHRAVGGHAGAGGGTPQCLAWFNAASAAEQRAAVPWDTLRSRIKRVCIDASFETFELRSVHGWFEGCQVLKSVSGLRYLNPSKLTDAACLFKDCRALAKLDLSGWHVPREADARGMLDGCTALDELVADASWQNSGASARRVAFPVEMYAMDAAHKRWRKGDALPDGAGEYRAGGLPMQLATVEIDKPVFPCTGKPVKPKLEVKLGDTVLVQGKDYTVAYANNILPGKASVTVTGRGAFTGGLVVPFTVRSAVSKVGERLTYRTKRADYTVEVLAVRKRQGEYMPTEACIVSVQVKGKKISKVVLPDTCTVGGVSVDVTAVGSKLAGGFRNVSCVVIGAKVTVIHACAFVNALKVKKLQLKTKRLAKATNCLKGSKIKKVRAVCKLSKKKRKAYKKMFEKKSGRSKVKFTYAG